VPSKVPQYFFKSSHSGNTLQCFKNFLLYVFTFSRPLITLMKCKRWSRCKQFNIYYSSCSKNFLSNLLQFYFLCYFLFSFLSQFCLPLVCSFSQLV
jgi:hypothetical protein